MRKKNIKKNARQRISPPPSPGKPKLGILFYPTPIPFLSIPYDDAKRVSLSYLLTVFSAATKTEVLTFKLNAGG